MVLWSAVFGVFREMPVLIADDHALFRQGVAALLAGTSPRLQICAEARNGKEAVEKTLALQPDIVLMDVSMPVMGGFDATRNILYASPASRIIFLTTYTSPQVAAEARKAGAKGYVAKGDVSDVLIQAIDAVSNNQTYFEGIPEH